MSTTAAERLAAALAALARDLPNPWDESTDYFHAFFHELPVSTRLDAASFKKVMGIGARYAPGERQHLHTHRFPVTLIVQQGVFTLEMEGRAPIALRAGQSFVEPPGVKITGYNRGDGELRLLMVYVSDVDAPFVDRVR